LKSNPIFIFVRRHLEALIWIAALLILAFSNPMDTCYSICPLHNLGINWCPGCGIGHSISWLFRGDIMQSMHAHPLGIPAVIIILSRIVGIFRKNYYYKSILTHKSIQNG